MGAGGFLPVVDIGEHDAGADDIRQSESGLLYRILDDFKTVSGLGVEITWRVNASIIRYWRCTGDGQVITPLCCAGETNCRFQR
ncbi:MAG: hypothetical protein Tsb002_34710 [Wenzhouxiangellaceae bacterium]